jgi:hypothetical protein
MVERVGSGMSVVPRRNVGMRADLLYSWETKALLLAYSRYILADRISLASRLCHGHFAQAPVGT